MAGSVSSPSTGSAFDYGDAAHYVVAGTNTSNDGKVIPGMALVDPVTGLPALPGSGGAPDAVEIDDGADIAQGSTSDLVTANTVIGLLKATKAALQGILAARIDQTTPGTTNAVAIDQSTPGTTNKVQIGAALPAGTNSVGGVTVADGADSAQGATTDASTANTVIGRLKKLLSVLPAALTAGGNLKTALQEALPSGTNSIGGVTVADGADAALGTTTDAASASTAIGLLKNVKAALAGILSVKIDQTTPGTTNAVAVSSLPAAPSGTNTIGGVFAIPSATHGASYAACPAATATTVKASAGALKALWISGTGVLGTVAIADGSTTYFTAEVPASLSTLALPLPPEGVAHATSIVVTTTGAGVTAAAVYA